MGAYNYQAIDANGKTVKGVLEGDSERHVRSQLRQQQLKPLDVRSSTKKSKGSSGKTGGGFKFSFGGGNNGGPKLNYRDVALITRQLSSLLQSGLPLDEVLHGAATQTKKPEVKSLLLQIRSRVLEGLSLAQAMSEAPRAFDHLYRAMVKAGESAGFLGPVLEQLAEYTENSQEIRQKVKMAMMYPIVLMCVSLGVVMALMAFVVPKLTGMFTHSKAQLPMITEILIVTSDFVVDFGLYVVMAIIGGVMFFKRFLRDPARLLVWHRFLLKVPLFGEFIRTSESARYANTLGLLLTSGVPLLEGLRIAGQVLTNRVMQEAGIAVALSVQEGNSLAKSMDQVDAFPPLLVQMAASGEANGELADQLLHAARNQDRELAYTLGSMMGLMEPAMILFMAGIVFFIVMAVMLPIFQMNDMVG